MPHAQRQRDLIASLRLEPLFEFGELGAFAPTPPAESSARGRLHAVLRKVGGTVDVGETADIEQSTAACRQAAANIETWRAYLPGDCVRAMIAAGWHWNT